MSTAANRSPRISAVIPTRNRCALVGRAVASALRQTLSDLEVIVVIDGADQKSERVLACIDDARLRVIALERPVGGSEARNVGVRAARSAWIAFLDDDDEWLSEKLHHQLQAAESTSATYPIIYSRFIGRTGSEDRLMAVRLPRVGEDVSEYLFRRRGFQFGETALGTSELFAPTELLLQLPFAKGLRRHQDWDWILRAARHPGTHITVLPQVLAIYNMEDSAGRLSSSTDWRSSLEWARNRRTMITPLAFAYFIATTCVPQARRAGARLREVLELARAFFYEGSPTFHATLIFVLFAFLPLQIKRVAQLAAVQRPMRPNSA